MFLVEQCPWYIAGPLLGLIVVVFQWAGNRPVGMTGAIAGVVEWTRRPTQAPNWRAGVFIGVLAGAALYAALTGSFQNSFSHGSFDWRVDAPEWARFAILFAGGTLAGYGARMAGGCTSGNGLCGVSRGSPASLAATATFSFTAMATAYLVWR